MNKLWAGRSEAETSALADAFNSSIAVDGRMYQQDITGSMAHAAMLAKCGILTQADADQIIVVNHGKIEATGTQAELLASCPLYQTMWEAHISVKDDGEVA